MKNAQTTIAGILAIAIPILNLIYKLVTGQAIDAGDMALLSGGGAVGYGLVNAKDAKTVETTIVQPVKPSGPATIEKTL